MIARYLLVIALLVPAGLRAEDKKDYSELTKLLHRVAGEKLPRQHEDSSDWGGTIPLPDRIRLPRIQRTIVMVNGRPEVPNGLWKRTKVTLDGPARALRIDVHDFSKNGDSRYRLKVEATVALRGEREWKEWLRGIHVIGLTAQADAVVGITLDCDVKVSFDKGTFPPKVKVEPTVEDVKLEMKDFRLNRVGPVLLEGERPRPIDVELKEVLQGLMRQYEPQVKERANEAIAKVLKENGSILSAADLLKIRPRE